MLASHIGFWDAFWIISFIAVVGTSLIWCLISLSKRGW